MNFFYLTKLGISEVSEFSILALILKSKTWKTRTFFSRFVIVLLEVVGHFWCFQVLDLVLLLKLETLKTGTCFQDFKIWENFSFISGNCEFRRFTSFWFWLICWNGKLGKLGISFKTCEFGFFKEVINFRDHSKVVLVLQKFVVATSKM